MMTRSKNDIITVPYVITGTRITTPLEDIQRNVKRMKNIEHLPCKKCIHRPISIAPYKHIKIQIKTDKSDSNDRKSCPTCDERKNSTPEN